ncbi:hypothetical protein ERO13_D11G177150v2 [Gossypium hirsutum]|nr:hypothetical protein ERO13_D11G177150v2 [Gossypium hirsutum]
MVPNGPFRTDFSRSCQLSSNHLLQFKQVYILDEVRAVEKELLLPTKRLGLNIKPQILVVHSSYSNG